LPDKTRWAASATASAISEPSLEALVIICVAAWLALSAASRPRRGLPCAPWAGSNRCRGGGQTRRQHFTAHRRLGDLVEVYFAGTCRCLAAARRCFAITASLSDLTAKAVTPETVPK
jgi:hypothetical protein